ncbi:hypothetical protein EMCRGX_G003516 [Ephydatia muelleri]
MADNEDEEIEDEMEEDEMGEIEDEEKEEGDVEEAVKDETGYVSSGPWRPGLRGGSLEHGQSSVVCNTSDLFHVILKGVAISGLSSKLHIGCGYQVCPVSFTLGVAIRFVQ